MSLHAIPEGAAPLNRYDLSHLSDGEVLAGTRRLVGASNQLFADLLAHLAEVEARGIHRAKACASLYTYCIYELRFSEDAAFRRASAARFVKAFPALFDAVASGELHLTGLLMLGAMIARRQVGEVLERAKHRTKKELAKLLREIDPLPDLPARITPLGPAAPEPKPVRNPTWAEFVASFVPVRHLNPGERPRDWIDEPTIAQAVETANSQFTVSVPQLRPAPPITGPQRFGVQFTATQEYADLVERAQALLSHTSEGASVQQLQLRAMRLLVAELEKKKYGARKRPPTELSAETAPVASPEASRHIPLRIRRRVFERDNAQCTFVDESGTRCRELQRLEIHHLKPFARAGRHHADNLTLRCQAHNGLAAEQDFGRELIETLHDSSQHESLRAQR